VCVCVWRYGDLVPASFRLVSVGVLVIVVAAGCRSGGPGAVRTATVTVTRTPSSMQPASSAAITSPPKTALAGTCDSLLPWSDVRRLAGAGLSVRTAFVVGVADKTIGRLAYLNCRYGMPPTGVTGQPQIEVGISLYQTPRQAQDRIDGTVSDYADHGAADRNVTVGQVHGALLTGGVGTGYDVPLLVVASDQRTVAVSMTAGLLGSAAQLQAMTGIVKLALERTG
jgi:hypothetical protein